mgnify:CR=1 FL=1
MPLTSLKKKWTTLSPDPDRVAALAREYHPTVAALLVNRDIQTIGQSTEFLTPRLTNLHDPSLLPSMAAATDRIMEAIDKKYVRQRSEHISLQRISPGVCEPSL